MIVLDTNVLSEIVRPVPAAEVLRWVAGHPSSMLYTTTITQAEILYGLELMPKGKRRAALEFALTAMFEEDFEDRILPFDSDAARAFAQVAVSRRAAGFAVAQMDAQIAAIARSRGAKLATRNIQDFEHCGVTLENPWDR